MCSYVCLPALTVKIFACQPSVLNKLQNFAWKILNNIWVPKHAKHSAFILLHL